MTDAPYIAVFEMGRGHVAYGAATLRAMPDLFGAARELRANPSAEEDWARAALRPHDSFVQSLLGVRGTRAVSLRVRVRPASPSPLTVSYILRTTGATEAQAEGALRDVWARFLSAWPASHFLLEPVREREPFDALFEMAGMEQAGEIRRPQLTVPLTKQLAVDYTVPFRERAMRWNDLLRYALSAGRDFVADVCLTPTRFRPNEADALDKRVVECRVVQRRTGEESAGLVGRALESYRAELRGGAALVRVVAAVRGGLDGVLSKHLRAAFACSPPDMDQVFEPEIVWPRAATDAQRSFQAVQLLLPPASSRGATSGVERLPWLCALSEAAGLFRPPILVPSEHPRIPFAVPAALEESLEKSKVIHMSGGVYVEKGAQISGSRVSADVHHETVAGDKIAGDKNVSVDSHDETVMGDRIGGDQIVAGDKVGAAAGPGEQVDGDQLAAGDARAAQAGPVCPKCGRPAPAAGKFCMECGARLPKRCPSCGHAAESAGKFCTECGAALGA